MKIKICDANVEKIEAALAAVNGRARLSFVSGGSVPKSYKNNRIATRIIIEHGSRDTFIVGIEQVMLRQAAGKWELFLTNVQDDLAVTRFRSKYTTTATRPELILNHARRSDNPTVLSALADVDGAMTVLETVVALENYSDYQRAVS